MPSVSELEYTRFIELVLRWEGKINTSRLQKSFNISRQTASKLLKKYEITHSPQWQYSASEKGYIPEPDFQPQSCQGTILEYSQLLDKSLSEHDRQFISTSFYSVEVPFRNINPELVKPIIRAIKNQSRIDIGYASVSSPDYEERIISPHSLVFSGIRWHVRAYCEKNQAYRDFVLSRFNGVFNEEGAAEFGAEQDELWKTWLDVLIEPDPRLSSAQKRIIEMDYQMQNGQRVIKTRAALLMYLLQNLHLEQYKPTAEAQQIIVNSDCWKTIEKYLPR